MLKLIIEDDEGRRSIVPFARDEISIGRQEGNAIRLSERNVSRRHARLRRSGSQILVEDLGSSYGVRINGKRIEGEVPFNVGDLLQIGDYDLIVQNEASEAPEKPAPTAKQAESRTQLEVPAAGLDSTQDHTKTQQVHTDPHAYSDRVNLGPDHTPRLLIINTELAGREFACIRDELRLGRSYDNDIAIEHPSLSRSHARLVLGADGAWELVDQGAVNGVHLDGVRIERAHLKDGDEFDLGHVRMRFLLPQRKRWGRKLLRGVGWGAIGLSISAGVLVLAMVGLLAFSPSVAAKVLPAQVVDRFAALPEDPAEVASEALVSVPDDVSELMATRIAPAVELANGREFQKAIQLIEALPDNVRSEGTEALLDQLRAELEVRTMLSEAQRFIDSGEIPEAQALITASRDTRAWRKELGIMMGRLVDARAAWKERTTKERAERAERVEGLYLSGRDALSRGQLGAAESAFQQCVALDPRAAPCHLGLGGTYARTRGKAELGATHYEEFLELSPEDPAAPVVQAVLANYGDAKRRAGR